MTTDPQLTCVRCHHTASMVAFEQGETGGMFCIDDTACEERWESRLDTLAGKINDLGRWYDEYNTENSDNVYADYCTWGWKEGDRDELLNLALNDSWVPELGALCELALAKGIKREALIETLVDVAGEPQYSAGYGRNGGEIYSMSIGEYEIQLSDEEWFKELCALDEEELTYLNRHCDFYIRDRRDYMYGSDDGRWCLIVDEGTLSERLVDEGTITQAESDEIFNVKGK